MRCACVCGHATITNWCVQAGDRHTQTTPSTSMAEKMDNKRERIKSTVIWNTDGIKAKLLYLHTCTHTLRSQVQVSKGCGIPITLQTEKSRVLFLHVYLLILPASKEWGGRYTTSNILKNFPQSHAVKRLFTNKSFTVRQPSQIMYLWWIPSWQK